MLNWQCAFPLKQPVLPYGCCDKYLISCIFFSSGILHGLGQILQDQVHKDHVMSGRHPDQANVR